MCGLLGENLLRTPAPHSMTHNMRCSSNIPSISAYRLPSTPWLVYCCPVLTEVPILRSTVRLLCDSTRLEKMSGNCSRNHDHTRTLL